MTVVLAAIGVSLVNRCLWQHVHFKADLVTVPSGGKEVGNLRLLHELAPVLMSG